jgi:hypothetical protein
MTQDDLENDEVFSAAVNGLPKVVELITAAPEEKRSLAFVAAHQAYLRTAQELGYDESDAQQWASAVMSLIVTNDKVVLGRVAADLLGRPSVLPERFTPLQIAHRPSRRFPHPQVLPLRQLRKIRRNPPRLILREQLRRRSPASSSS